MAENTGKPRRKLSLRLGISLGAFAAIFALIAAGVGLRYWIASDGGRAFIVSQIDGRRLGPLGVIRIQGKMEGDPLAAASLADIALVDDDGVWLRAKDARIEWTPQRLFGGELEIKAIQVKLIDVLRRPRTSHQSRSDPPPDIGLKLDSVIIDELKLSETIFSPAASYRIAGGAARPRDGSGLARFDLAPLTGPGDKIDASVEWTAEGSLKGAATAMGPAGGLIAALLKAPQGAPVTLLASVDGAISAFTGEARLAFGGQSVAVIAISRKGDTARLNAKLEAALWPALEPLARRAGGALALSAEANLANPAKTPFTLELTAAAGRISVHATLDTEDGSLSQPVRLATHGLDLALLAPPLTGTIDADGTARVLGPFDFEWEGEASATAITWPSGEAARISAPLVIAREGPSISWETRAAIIEDGRITSLKSLAPARYAAATRGEVNLRTRAVEVTTAQIRGAPGEATGRGAYTIDTGAFAYSGAASLARLSDIAPLTGAARGQWSLTRASHKAPIRITANATGREVSSHIATLASLAGPSPTARITGLVRDGRFILESGRATGAGASASMTGRVADSGEIAARAFGALSQPLSLPGAGSLNSLSLTADVSGQMQAPRVALRLSNGSVSLAGMTADRLAGEANVTLGDKLGGDFALSGGASDQPLFARGKISSGRNLWRINNLQASLGGLHLNAPELEYDEGVFSAAFEASGSLAGYAGLERGRLTAQGALSLGEDLDLEISGQLQDLRRGRMLLDVVNFNAEASAGQAAVSGRLKGKLGAPIDMQLGAAGRRNGDGWAGTATLEGMVDTAKVATSRRANWSFGDGEWAMDTDLNAFEGALSARLALTEQGASATLRAESVEMSALSRLARITPIGGKLSGAAFFSNGLAPATGDFFIKIENANRVGIKANPVEVNLTGRLENGRLRMQGGGEGQGFKLDVNSTLPIIAGKGFSIRPDISAPVQGSVRLSGRVEQLWAVFGPDGQALHGQVEADVQLAGTLEDPRLTGGFSLARGAYQHGETGLSLRNLRGKGEFDRRSARISEVAADDGQGGILTGQGEIDWEDGVDGAVQFTAAGLRALARDDRSAVVSGEGAVRLHTDAIAVTGELSVLQARISIEQPASASIPRIPVVKRANFPNQEEIEEAPARSIVTGPVQLDLKVTAPRRVVVFGRGLDTEWSVNLRVKGPIANPEVQGTASMVRGDLDLAGRRFEFDAGSINLDGPIASARIDIAAKRTADDIDAKVHITGSPVEPKFELESTPSLPQDEILARVLFGRSMAELSAFEAAQLAAGLTQLAGGNAGFDPVGLVRQATGLDRVSIGASGGRATVSAGKYIAEDVYLQVGAGGEGAIGAEVEWEPRENLSILSSAQGNGDTKIVVRWKNDY